MTRKQAMLFMLVLVIFALAAAVVLPINGGLLFGKGMRLGLDLQGGTHIVYQADLSGVEPGGEDTALDGVVAVLGNRVNPLGVTEPIIQKQGGDRILVQLPGVSISDADKERLGRVDLLEFGELAADEEEAKWENELGRWKPATGEIDGVEKALTSSYFKANTYVTVGSMGEVLLIFEWNEEGSILSEQITTRLIGQPLGIFEGDQALLGEDDYPIAPTVQGVIEDKGQIEGLSYNEATKLSQQLNYGRLPVPLEIIYNQTVSPTLGADFVDMSVRAGIIGILVVMFFMIAYYRLSGVVASLGLVYYGVLLLAVFKLLGVTLTLSAIGGFILSVGMAIDANVLIFERMKEELWGGRTLGAAIEAGFKRAWPAIWDSNITTILAGLVLYWLGSSIAESASVQGFALTLVIGVAASMFTAITVTRTFLRPFVGTSLAQPSLFAPYQRRKNA